MKLRAIAAVAACVGAFAAFPASSSADLVIDPGPILILCSIGDMCAPSITSGPVDGSVTNAAGATFAFERDPAGPFNIISFECALDAGSFAACTSPKVYPLLSQGTHEFRVKAKKSHFSFCDSFPPGPCIIQDGYTNIRTRTFTLDRTSPVSSFTAGPANLSTITTATTAFEFTATDATAVTFACSLDGAAAAACTSPASLAGLANGTHTFAVTPTDAAGNVGATISRAFTVAVPPPVIPGPAQVFKTVKKCKKVKVKRHGRVVRKKNGKIKYKKKCKKVQVLVS